MPRFDNHVQYTVRAGGHRSTRLVPTIRLKYRYDTHVVLKKPGRQRSKVEYA